MLSSKMQVMLDLADLQDINIVIVEAKSFSKVFNEQIEVDIQHLLFIKKGHEDFSLEIKDDIEPIHNDWYLAIKYIK